MKCLVGFAVAAALVVATLPTPVEALPRSHTRTNVCKGRICATVRTGFALGIYRGRFTEVWITRSPSRSRINMRCENGLQVDRPHIACRGHEVSVQACFRVLLGRSSCNPWIVFR